MTQVHRIRPFIFFIVLVAGGVFILTMTTMGYYPIVLVGGSPITAHEFWKHYDASLASRRNQENALQALEASSTAPAAAAGDTILEKDLQAMVLDSLIEEKIVHKELSVRLGGDLAPLVDEKVAKISSDANLRKATAFVFGMPFSQMKDIVFVPQVEHDILAGKLFMNGEKFEDWIQTARKSASVTILSPKYAWEDGKVAAKK